MTNEIEVTSDLLEYFEALVRAAFRPDGLRYNIDRNMQIL